MPGKPKPHAGDSSLNLWLYDGTPVTPELKEQLIAQDNVVFAVHPDGDILPDGIHLKPRRIWRNRRGKSHYTPTLWTEENLRARQQKRWEEYDALPSPRPDYMEWAAQQSRREQFEQLEMVAFTSKKSSYKLKALATILEFSKRKPKQELDVTNRQEQEPVTPEKLVDYLAAALGVNKSKLEEFVKTQVN